MNIFFMLTQRLLLSVVFIGITVGCMLVSTPQTVFIVIHGTWAKKSTWAQPGGDFFTALEQSVSTSSTTVTSFSWSGNLDNESRRAAGKALAEYIQTYPTTTTFNIIGHSHGANVGILACNELATRQPITHTINAFYALAAPVNTNEYMPTMTGINSFYNFFSLNDLVQPVFGIFGRIYPQHPRIANIRLTLNGKEPDHDQLHNPCIAQWLTPLHLHYMNNPHTYLEPVVVDIAYDKKPRFALDTERKELLTEDRKLIAHLLTVFRTKH